MFQIKNSKINLFINIGAIAQGLNGIGSFFDQGYFESDSFDDALYRLQSTLDKKEHHYICTLILYQNNKLISKSSKTICHPSTYNETVKLLKKLKKVSNIERMNNPEFYLVGGSVRDLIMQIPSNDKDYTTNLSFQELIWLCELYNEKYFVLNEKHFTVSIIKDNQVIEITPFRTEINNDGRHANCKHALTLNEDLSRRDFTFNAAALPLDSSDINSVIDPFNGIEDIKNKIIRTVGNPEKRFHEDYLRIIRGLRFATVFKFKIEENTWKAMKKLSSNIKKHVSIERICQETEKLFKTADNPAYFFEMLDELGLLQEYFPLLKRVKIELKDKLPTSTYHPEGQTWNHILDLLDHSKRNLKLRWAILTHDLGKIEEYQDKGDHYSFIGHDKREDLIDLFFSNLKVEKETIKFCKFIMANHMKVHVGMKLSKVRKLIAEFGEEMALNLSYFCALDKYHVLSENVFLDQINEILNEVIPLKPKVDGNFLIEKGFKPGKELGKAKENCWTIQLEEPDLEKEEIYKKYLEKYFYGLSIDK